MKTLFTLLILSVASCAPRAVVVDPIAPKATVVHEQAKAALASGKRVTAATSKAHAEASGIATEVNKAFAEVDRLKKLDPDPDKFDDLVALMTDLSAHSQIHIVTSATADTQAKDTEHMQEAVVSSAGEAVTQAKATDKQTAEQAVKNAVLQKDADKWNTLQNLAIGGGILLALVVGGLLILRAR